MKKVYFVGYYGEFKKIVENHVKNLEVIGRNTGDIEKAILAVIYNQGISPTEARSIQDIANLHDPKKALEAIFQVAQENGIITLPEQANDLLLTGYMAAGRMDPEKYTLEYFLLAKKLGIKLENVLLPYLFCSRCGSEGYNNVNFATKLFGESVRGFGKCAESDASTSKAEIDCEGFKKTFLQLLNGK